MVNTVTPTSELALADSHPELMAPVSWLEIQDTVFRHIAPRSNDAERAAFIMHAQAADLDPRLNEIMLVSFGKVKVEINGREQYVDQHVPYVGLNGVRKIAARSGRQNGVDGPYYCGRDGQFVPVWTSDDAPFAARFSVFALNPYTGEPMERPFTAVVTMKRARTYKDKQGVVRLMGKWETDPALMLAKCAEIQAYKMAGLFTNVQLDIVDQHPEEFEGYDPETGEVISERRSSPSRHLHAIAARRGVGHAGARKAVQAIAPEVESLADATPDQMNQAADLLDVLDADAVAEIVDVDVSTVTGEPADVVPAKPDDVAVDGDEPDSKLIEWLETRESRIDFYRLSDDDRQRYADRYILSDASIRDLIKSVSKVLKPPATPAE